MISWDIFFREKCIDIFTNSKEVIDIGGGLRIDGSKNNRTQSDREWLVPYMKKVDYKVLDPVSDYNPDIVGDIHSLPFGDSSKEAIVCLAVLEHVENPIKAMSEMHRTLRPGGKLLIYVPFLYYYHAHKGYYGDYWRFTIDTLEMFAKPFSKSEIVPVRLPIETLCRLTPFGRYNPFVQIARWLDGVFYKKGSNQVAGYYLYLEK
ncbi:class I SAM-dependent methyltransferase [Candidatus Nomurabacteria bacterium]|nr:class I SAM-dependent methyltransferase [Candidatus Nomurabacteria bacterium]